MIGQDNRPGTEIKKENREAAAQILSGYLRRPAEHTLIKRLVERKINHETLMLFDVQATGEGWTYQAPNGERRFKNVNSKADNKYAWMEDRKTHAPLLYAFDIFESIQQAESTVWLCTEFDVLAMRSAGINNVIGQFPAETSVPWELPAMLQSWGVMVVYIVPDNDATGRSWAQKVTDQLTPAGLDVIVRTLPAAMGEGADIGRAWMQYTGGRSFERYLLDLSTHRLEASPQTQQIEVTRQIQNAASDDIKRDIAEALGVYHWTGKGYAAKDNGKTLRINCLFHPDHNPSAGLHKDYALHCFTCGWHGWKELAAALGIDWPATAKEIKQPLPRPMLADEVLQAMIREGFSVLAESLERMYKAGWVIGSTYTGKDLTGLLLSRKRATRTLQQMAGDGRDLRKLNARGLRGKRLRIVQGSIFVPELSLFFFILKEGLIKVQNSKIGRPSKEFTLPEPEQIAAAFGVLPVNYSDIASKKKTNQWRAEVHAAPIDKQPGMYSRPQLCKPLKISVTTSRKYTKLAGVTVTANHKREIITSDEILPEDYQDAQKLGYLETDDGAKYPATKAGYNRALRIGGRVWCVKRLANSYSRSKSNAQKLRVLDEILLDVLEAEYKNKNDAW